MRSAATILKAVLLITLSARQNQRESPLLRLPAELRHRIFEYALSGHVYFIKIIEARFSPFGTLETVSKAADNAFVLLQVCRQIYAETALLRISLSVFSTPWPGLLHKWLGGLLEAKFNVISKIHLRFNLCPSAPPRSDYYLVSHPDHALMDFTRLPALKRIRVSFLNASSAAFFCADAINKKGREVAHQIEMLNPKVTVTADWCHINLVGEQSWDATTDIPLGEDWISCVS